MAGLLPLFGITLWQSYNWKTKYLEIGTAPISWTICYYTSTDFLDGLVLDTLPQQHLQKFTVAKTYNDYDHLGHQQTDTLCASKSSA